MDYITLVKGDDTNFVDDQYIKIKFVTDLDFTGFTGYFTLGGVTLNYTNISSKVINVVLNNSFTSALTVGKQYAELKLKDPQNRYRTITSVIPIKVVDVVTVQPTYVNNVIECHSDVNNTTIEVNIETAGIAQSTADEYVTTMNSILTQTQSKANEASSSAVNARTSEVNAKSYMDYAKDYKDLANTSAGNAATSATFVEETVNGFDTHVAGKQSDFDSNATSKTDTFNSNATSKTETFNANATSKTNDFNTNYNTKKLAIDNAVTQAQRYATGTPSEPDGYSAKYWAERASQGQIQADWTQDDNTKQDYIKNKPTKLSDFTDDLGTSPIHTHSQYLTLEDISGKEDISNKGIANGYAGLDADGKVPKAQLPNTGSGLELCDIGMALYVDETKGLRRYLNGQIVDINANTQAFLDRLKQITTLHPSLLCTEDEWQTAKTMSAFGQVGKFVFNYSGDEIISVLIPAIVNVQGLFDLQNLGMTVAESLPNINGSLSGTCSGTNGNLPTRVGCMDATGTGIMIAAGTDSVYVNNATISVDASRSSSTYQNGAPVQQEAIQYPYFIQIATGSETENNIINDIELNNPYSLFDSKYSDHELNNISWLKSEGQWNAKAVYPDVYDKLLKVQNGTETVEGLSVKLSTETYTDYDFVLNTAEETFRLPLLDGSENIIDYTNGENLSFVQKTTGEYTFTTKQNGLFSLGFVSSGTEPRTLIELKVNDKKVNKGQTAGFSAGLQALLNKGDILAVKVSLNPLASLNWQTFFPCIGNGSLYFYVGETVQNANLIDAGRIGEQLATKTDMLQASGAGMPSSKYIDLTLGESDSSYTAPANGYVQFIRQLTSNSYTWQITGVLKDGQTIVSVANMEYRMGDSSSSISATLEQLVPVKSGRTFFVSYGGGSAKLWFFRFIYAEGSK